MAILPLNMTVNNQEKIACSVGILTFNSERTIREALESVKNFKEIIICDGGSNDKTLEVAGEYNAKIIFQDPKYKNSNNTIKDFSGVRNQCLEVSTQDWFVYIDSDEAVSLELNEEIKKIIKNKKETFLVYRVPNKLVIDGVAIKYSSSYPGFQYRFFNKKSGARFVKSIHERIEFDKLKIKVGTLESPWLILWDKEEVREYFEHRENSIQMEVLRNRNQNFFQFLYWSIGYNLITAAKIFLKAFKNYLFYGFSTNMPIQIEKARVFYHFKLIKALVKDRVKLYS
ncbi:MAG: Glycosyl transferase family 2 [Candidatus Magasanikbacteria bacterium GW2011_GWC2_40_17]|uniref:Glycosyl transferase family 2 n=1 Tax=Candidatus Magasanikbacteria bacterium GW2011_GWA2_42_32 TaxID=1619039 RepID=A0A0G1A8L2_9BACT|nr:MAG: Glycosyl transferase family 2 [Candidatus Magasanikbacteria bacterium GW2011_GWC2_40_17]KKS57382.1 MAG: Glycosyl transferase family 2 [Candidatus Magasanikbacteria bacterium GW2011_GWA2_42_32]